MKNSNKIQLAIVIVLTIASFYGFFSLDPINGSKKQTNDKSQIGYTPVVQTLYGTPVYTDNMDGDNTIAALQARGYLIYNNSVPVGSLSWFQGNATVFPAFNGPTTGYVAANYNSTSGAGTIDNWLILPRVTGGTLATDSLTFWARSTDLATQNWADSIYVMFSVSDSTPTGTWSILGKFKVPNPATGAPNNGYTYYAYKAAAAGVNARFAIRYHVTDAGPSGSNSDYIGVDAINIIRNAPPVSYSWTEKVSGISTELSSVSAVDDNIMWACGASGKVVKTTNGGLNFSVYTLPATNDAYNIFAWDANTALVTASPTAGAYIYKTTNGGVNWTQTFFLANAFGDALWMTDANTAYFMGDPIGGNWLLKKSTDGGTTWADWATVPTTITGGWNNSFFVLGTKVWFGSNTTSIMYSSNMGANWSTQTTPSANQYGIWFNDANNGMSIYNSLAMTTNGGTNWAAITSPVTYAAAGVCGTGTQWWATTQNTTPDVYFSSNNGASWTTQYTAPTSGGVFRHITKARTGNTIWGVRSLGGISKYGQTVGITPVGTVTPTEYALSQNYPNPFNPTTKINFAIPKSGMVSLKVYNILGKEVATLVNQNMTSGTYNYEFNASNLSSGIYFYKLDVNGFSQVKKMSLVK
jgi:hypothetical protein